MAQAIVGQRAGHGQAIAAIPANQVPSGGASPGNVSLARWTRTCRVAAASGGDAAVVAGRGHGQQQ